MAPIQLIHDATIVTADDAGSILYDAAIAVGDGRIAALGPTYAFHRWLMQSALQATPRQYSALISNVVQALAKLEDGKP